MLLFIACARLPEGWEDAQPVDSLVQRSCATVEEAQFSMTATVDGGNTEVTASEVLFRCDQEVEGFWREDADGASLLVQPVDMHPRRVAKCDCAYDLEISFPAAEGTLTFYRRWDALNDPNDPVEMGSLEL